LGRDLLQVVDPLAQSRHQPVVDRLGEVHEDAPRPDDGAGGRLAVAVVDRRPDVRQRALEAVGAALRDERAAIAAAAAACGQHAAAHAEYRGQQIRKRRAHPH
jgi:hypothetical protein